MRRRGLTIFLLAFAAACSTIGPMQPVDPNPSAPRLRVMTYNIEKGSPVERVADDIREHSPDIVLLQEVDDQTRRSGGKDQTAELAEALDMRAFYAASYQDDGGTTGEAILSRFPLRDTLVITLPDSRNIGAAATVETPGGPVRVMSVHFSSVVQAKLSDGWNSAASREREAERIVALLDDRPTIVGGDFNAGPGSEPWRILEGKLQSVGKTAATFPASMPIRRIDHVFVSPDFAVRSAFAASRGVSDHRPVVVDLVPRGSPLTAPPPSAP